MLDDAVKKRLQETARRMVAPGKGLLAADESIGSVEKRFAPIHLENTEENRRAFRDMLLTVEGMGNYISGVILFDETIKQESLAGKSFVSVLEHEKVLPGIKVDKGRMDAPDSPTEKLTKGIEDLDTRLQEYLPLRATFCKWRSLFIISDTTPTDKVIAHNIKDLALYAQICQKNGLVPIVEPEVLMDGNHTREEARIVTEKVLTATFEELSKLQIYLPGVILKTSMVIKGKESSETETPAIVAQETVSLLKKVVPQNIGGIVFLSGGQTETQATENLNAMHQLGQLPWPLTFSYARALQNSATSAWNGKLENVPLAQKIFLHRAKMNSLASLGKYQPEMEKEISA